jgi:hypothetical protein
MLSTLALLIAPAAAGLAGVPVGTVAAGPGLVGLAMAALFAGLLGLLASTGTTVEDPEAESAGWIATLDWRIALLCAGAFSIMGTISGSLAWAAWEMQGPGGAIGLAAVALLFASGALAFGSRALRRR